MARLRPRPRRPQRDEPRQPSRLAYEIGERVAVEHLEERVRRFPERAAQPARRRQRTPIAVAIEALHDRQRALGLADDGPEPDLLRRQRQTEAARPPAMRLEIAEMLEAVDHLHEVMAGDAEGNRDLLAGTADIGT